MHGLYIAKLWVVPNVRKVNYIYIYIYIGIAKFKIQH